jgi:hypothetical protein
MWVTYWVYVVNTGSGTPLIKRRSDPGITVLQVQPGQYIVVFPPAHKFLTCLATLNSGGGIITAIPGDAAGLPANQVTVLTGAAGGGPSGPLDFSLAVFASDPALVFPKALEPQGPE